MSSQPSEDDQRVEPAAFVVDERYTAPLLGGILTVVLIFFTVESIRLFTSGQGDFALGVIGLWFIGLPLYMLFRIYLDGSYRIWIDGRKMTVCPRLNGARIITDASGISFSFQRRHGTKSKTSSKEQATHIELEVGPGHTIRVSRYAHNFQQLSSWLLNARMQ